MVRQRDDDWMMIVKWTLYAMINAEELGITSKNIDEALKSKKPDVMRLVGTEGTYGEDLGLTKDWAARIIRHVGNYGEVYERNVGAEFETEDSARAELALEQWRHPVRPANKISCQPRPPILSEVQHRQGRKTAGHGSRAARQGAVIGSCIAPQVATHLALPRSIICWLGPSP